MTYGLQRWCAAGGPWSQGRFAAPRPAPLDWAPAPRVVVPPRTPPGQECSKGRRALPGTRGVPVLRHRVARVPIAPIFGKTGLGRSPCVPPSRCLCLETFQGTGSGMSAAGARRWTWLARGGRRSAVLVALAMVGLVAGPLTTPALAADGTLALSVSITDTDGNPLSTVDASVTAAYRLNIAYGCNGADCTSTQGRRGAHPARPVRRDPAQGERGHLHPAVQPRTSPDGQHQRRLHRRPRHRDRRHQRRDPVRLHGQHPGSDQPGQLLPRTGRRSPRR